MATRYHLHASSGENAASLVEYVCLCGALLVLVVGAAATLGLEMRATLRRLGRNIC